MDGDLYELQQIDFTSSAPSKIMEVSSMMVPLFPWNQHEYQYPNMGSSGTASIEDVTQNEKQSWQKTTLASVIAAKTINRV